MVSFGRITTPYQDAISLLLKVQALHDMIDYNCTLALGDKYQDWVQKHEDLIDELLIMLEGDLDAKEKQCR